MSPAAEPLDSPQPNTFVDAFARGLAVLEAFNADRTEMSLSEVAAAANISRAAARRLLLTLCQLGYASHNGRTFRLTPRVLRLGYAYLSGQPLASIVEPYVLALAERTGESCSVCVLDGTEVVYIARASTRRVMSLNLGVGSRLPAWATANGRVLLGGLTKARRHELLRASGIKRLTPSSTTSLASLEKVIEQAVHDGYSLVDRELEPGLTALAMPLYDRSGAMAASINVAGHAERNPVERMLKEHLPQLRRTAKAINDALGAR